MIAALAAAKQEAAEANAKLAAAKLVIERLDAENAAYRRSRAEALESNQERPLIKEVQ